MPILNAEAGKGALDDFRPTASLQIALVQLVEQLHERLTFIREDPTTVGCLQDDRECITVIEGEWRPYDKAAFSFRNNLDVGAYLALEIPNQLVNRKIHGSLREQRMLRAGLIDSRKPAVAQHAPQRRLPRRKPVRWFREAIGATPSQLVAFRRHVNMIAFYPGTFDPIVMATIRRMQPIVPAEAY